MMIYCFLFLGFSFVALIRDVSSCDSQCADRPVFTPSSLVVEFGHLASASCSVCQKDCLGNIFNIEKSVGKATKNGTTVSWTVERLTEWHASPLCYYNTNNDTHQCCTELPVTLYQPPQAVSLHFDGGPGHTGPMVEGQESTLVCEVHDVAPLGKMVVTFYRDQTPLDQKQYPSKEKTPQSHRFLFNITLSKEDDGVPYRCEAKLELGPEGPQPPPVVRSENVTANVTFKPQFMDQIHQVRVRVTRGESLQLNCSAVGNPRPSYTWTTPSNAPSSTKSSVLTINAVMSADAGQYTCSVRNLLGTVTKEFKVDVYNNTWWIILIVILVIVLLVAIMVFVCRYSKNHNGRYNLMEVFHLHQQRSSLSVDISR